MTGWPFIIKEQAVPGATRPLVFVMPQRKAIVKGVDGVEYEKVFSYDDVADSAFEGLKSILVQLKVPARALDALFLRASLGSKAPSCTVTIRLGMTTGLAPRFASSSRGRRRRTARSGPGTSAGTSEARAPWS